MKKIIDPKFLLPIPIALLSLEAYLGMLFGYFLGKFLAGKETGKSGLIKSIVFNVGKWKIHLHHWVIGLGVLISGIFYSFLPVPQFAFGFLGGLIFQGVYCYPDWYRILLRKK